MPRNGSATPSSDRWRLTQAEGAIDNLRAAFAWSRDNGDIEHALALTSMLWPLWVARGRLREGLAWLDAAFAEAAQESIESATLARALADRAGLNAQLNATNQFDDARRALEIAREIGDPALIAWALAACASSAAFNTDVARPYVEEAIELGRDTGDRAMLCQALAWYGQIAFFGGNPRAGRLAAEEGREIAEATGDRFLSRAARWALAWARMVSGELTSPLAQYRAVAVQAAAEGDATWANAGLASICVAACRCASNPLSSFAIACLPSRALSSHRSADTRLTQLMIHAPGGRPAGQVSAPRA